MWNPVSVASIGFAAIGGFAILGIASAVDASFLGGYFRLNGEWTVPAFASAVPLLAGGLVGLAIARRRVRDRLPWVGFASVLGWMAFDEVLAVHERLEAAAGVDWQLLYLPVAAFAMLCWAVVRTRLGSGGRLLLVGGAAAWVGSQAFELVQWQGDTKTPYYLMLVVPEELLEMTGSLLFLLALLTVPGPRPSRPADRS
jgi:hypothetical protein